MSTGNSLAMMPWFARDYLAATRAMRLAERGAYCDLLFYQWEMGDLPGDAKSLARLLGAERAEFEGIWKNIRHKFIKRGTRLVNVRLEEHRLKAISQRQKKIDAAKKTNEKRYGERPINGSHSASLSDTLSASPPSPSPSPINPTLPSQGRVTRQRRSPQRAERDKALAAWSTVVATQGAVDDPKARQAMRAIGGYSRIGLRTVHEESQIRREFVEAYVSAGP